MPLAAAATWHDALRVPPSQGRRVAQVLDEFKLPAGAAPVALVIIVQQEVTKLSLVKVQALHTPGVCSPQSTFTVHALYYTVHPGRPTLTQRLRCSATLLGGWFRSSQVKRSQDTPQS